MKRVSVMAAGLDWEELEELEAEAKQAGVPLEYYYVEGWRKALWEALKEREAALKEREVEQIRVRHLEVDRNMAAGEAILKANVARRHKRRPEGWR